MSIQTNTLDVPKEPARRRAWVVYQLRVRGSSLRRLALQERVSVSAIANALVMPPSHLEQPIAKALGLAVIDLFPEPFDDAGERIHRTRERQRISQPSPRNGKGARAA